MRRRLTWVTLPYMLERGALPEDDAITPLTFLFERKSRIHSVVLHAGMDQDNMASMLAEL